MSNSIESLARAYQARTNTSRSQVTITRLVANDEPGETRAFQYFPDSLTDSKGVNWSPKDIPGGSLPVYQWTGGGERAIGFTATFTADMDFSESEKAASQITEGRGGRSVDIRSAVAWLRSFILPSYASSGSDIGYGGLTRAPNKLRLTIPNSGIGQAGGYWSLDPDPDSIVAVMAECAVTWEAFFPSGIPRIATVGLNFLQVPQYQGQVAFPQADADYIQVAETGGSYGGDVPFLGYNVRKA